ncbi:MAG: LysR family transcriptional regulator [Rhodobacteraceae bacterium]|nr:LysR family transcriptional regulator [Paracoccaceae bacterium]MAY47461.1 LysR family transcriptional regulator [Paracoccaceae bacterium]
MDVLRTMRLFVAISETGSLSAVARRWGVAPSTVSLGLQQLEAQLGAQLVLRTTRQLSLTSEGEMFLARSRRVLAEVDDAMRAFGEAGRLSGHLRITATNDLGRARVAPLLDRFLTDHPGVTADLFLSDQVVDLVEGGFDIGIRTGPLPSSDLKARLLLRGHKSVCAAPDYWKRRGKPAHPRDLADHDCILLGGPGEAQVFWTFREEGRAFRIRVTGPRQANDGETLRHWAIAGGGVVMKSSFDVAEDLAAGRLETALDAFTTEATNLYAVTPPREHAPRRVGMFMDMLSRGLG